MNVGILADTHDHIFNIKKFLALFLEKGVEQVIHAGDICSPFALEPFRDFGRPVRMIFGNNDGDHRLLHQRAAGFIELHEIRPWSFEIGGKRVLLMHEPDFLESFTKSGDYDVIIYGHTHTPETNLADGVRVINPGEGCGWLRGLASAVRYDVEKDEVEWLYLS